MTAQTPKPFPLSLEAAYRNADPHLEEMYRDEYAVIFRVIQ